ncbi:DUF4258 domain-containing protein [uncultured Croceitalea sp.]|uniref:DUF4258 domain-containing protein n=1 Tax=uncultured Croceitalea sp. TaxID=1798908 RepID=UPI0033063F23
MAFIKRLGWYLVGVSIGLVFLAFILKKKSGEEGINFCYLPNCRALKDFKSKPITYSSKAEEQMTTMQLDSLYFSNAFMDGDVDFGKSDTKAQPCKIYFVNFEEKEIELKNCEKEIVIENIVRKK